MEIHTKSLVRSFDPPLGAGLLLYIANCCLTFSFKANLSLIDCTYYTNFSVLGSYFSWLLVLSYDIYLEKYVEFVGPLVSTPPMIGRLPLLVGSCWSRFLTNQSYWPKPAPMSPAADGMKTELSAGFLFSGLPFWDLFGRENRFLLSSFDLRMSRPCSSAVCSTSS